MAMLAFVPAFAFSLTYEEAEEQALYLTDKMCYELDLTDEQADAVYEINMDYFLSVEGEDDLYGRYWSRRNSDLKYVLLTSQYRLFTITDYFYKPISWFRGFVFNIFHKYPNRKVFYRSKPSSYKTYKGGNNKMGVSAYKKRDISQKKETKNVEPAKQEIKRQGSQSSKKKETPSSQKQTTNPSQKKQAISSPQKNQQGGDSKSSRGNNDRGRINK